MPRSTNAEMQRRINCACVMLERGADRASTVDAMRLKFKVDRRTAQRYVAAAAQDVVGDEMSLPNLDATAGLTIRKLMQLSRTAEEQGDLKLVLSIQKSIAGIVGKRIRDQETTVARKLDWFA